MTLIAKRKGTDEFVAISDIATISENITHNIYYLSGEFDPRSATKSPLTISIDGVEILKTYNIEFDTKLFYSMRIQGTADVNN